jgi:hypothetical protein
VAHQVSAKGPPNSSLSLGSTQESLVLTATVPVRTI